MGEVRGPGGRRPADLILRGGVVHTETRSPSSYSGIAVRDGRVLCTGSDREVSALADARSEVIELAGRAVLPGINDAHAHAAWLGARWPDTLLDGHAPGPTRPLRDAAQRRWAILRAGDLFASLGITSYTEPGIGPGEDNGATGAFGSPVVHEYATLAAQGLLRARVTVLSLYGQLDGPSEFEAVLAGLGDILPAADPRWLRFAGVKIFADGIPSMCSAYTDRPYACGRRAELLVGGLDNGEREANLGRMIRAAHLAGRQVGVHATGDRSIEVVLDAIERARAEYDVDLGHYIVHGDLVTRRQLARMAKLGVGLDMQPGIAVANGASVHGVFGTADPPQAWPLSTALESGLPLCLTSDAPVLAPDWRHQIAAADEWLGPTSDPQRRMRRLLHCYTAEPARQDGAGSWKGTLAPGAAADLCVLEADPLQLEPAQLPEIAVDTTIVDGRVVYDRAAGDPVRERPA